jgi:hypothetical protein
MNRNLNTTSGDMNTNLNTSLNTNLNTINMNTNSGDMNADNVDNVVDEDVANADISDTDNNSTTTVNNSNIFRAALNDISPNISPSTPQDKVSCDISPRASGSNQRGAGKLKHWHNSDQAATREALVS